MAEHLSHAGTKRSYSSTSDAPQAHKKRRLHRLRHVQPIPPHVEPAIQGGCAPQGPHVVRAQLDKSISAALVMAGFEGARPEALEMFKTHAEEYMLRFANNVRVSMQGARRTQPTAQDFSMALSLAPNTSTASLLKAQLKLPVPASISCPPISRPEQEDCQPPDLSRLLQPLATARPPSYIPKHFPPLPPRHTWVQTPVFAEREKDARKMREKMTQEGMLAEQALRKLATAAKASALNAEKKKSNALSGPGKVRNGRRVESKDSGFADVMGELGGLEDGAGMGVGDDAADALMADGVGVNYDAGHWRQGRKSMRS
ncbi:hypothetical protein LTR08_007661 [Meristemomyces frigidus]|nr:hypothetical protein LTR08_007661 [Meristemomyces frigidus]